MADPLARRLVQPDQRSCGAAVLVVARLLERPSYAGFVASPDDFRSEVLAMHRRVTGPVDVRGRLQLPWPRDIGTPPWAVARQLSGTTGVEHGVHLTLFDRGDAFGRIARATTQGHPVPVYVGSRWLPRHVVLAVEATPGRLRFYEPAGGREVDVSRQDFEGGALGLGGWDHPWFMILPRGAHSRA